MSQDETRTWVVQVLAWLDWGKRQLRGAAYWRFLLGFVAIYRRVYFNKYTHNRKDTLVGIKRSDTEGVSGQEIGRSQMRVIYELQFKKAHFETLSFTKQGVGVRRRGSSFDHRLEDRHRHRNLGGCELMRAGPRKTGSMGERRLECELDVAMSQTIHPRPARFLQLIAHPHKDLALSRLA